MKDISDQTLEMAVSEVTGLTGEIDELEKKIAIVKKELKQLRFWNFIKKERLNATLEMFKAQLYEAQQRQQTWNNIIARRNGIMIDE